MEFTNSQVSQDDTQGQNPQPTATENVDQQNYISNSNQEPNQTPSSQTTNPYTSNSPVQKPKSYKGLIFLGALILLTAALGGGAYYKYNQEKEEILKATNTQIKELENLEKKIVELQDNLKEMNKVQPKIQPQIETKPDTSVNVLGLEDSRPIQQSRKQIELTTELIGILEQIEKNTSKVQEALNKSKIYTKINPLKPPIEETLKFTKENKAGATYFIALTKITIDATTYGFEFGQALNTAIIRQADDISIKLLEEKLKQIKSIEQSYLDIDTSKLSPQNQLDHKKGAAYFKDTFTVFERVVEALKKKDVKQLQKELLTMLSQGTSDTESGITSLVSGWQQGQEETKTLKKSWETFKETVK